MTRLEHVVDIERSIGAVYARASDVERYPEFLPGYLSSRIVQWVGGEALVERRARVRNRLRQWRSWVSFQKDRSIRFRHATGPLEGMTVQWQMTPLAPSRTRLSIVHEIHVGRPWWVGRWLERFVYAPQIGELASRVVAAFKQACEKESTPS